MTDFNISWDVREKWTKPPYLNFQYDEYEDRLAKIKMKMDEEGLECLLIHGSPNYIDGNLRYVSGFESSFGNSLLFLPIEGEPVLITDSIPYNEPMHAQLFQTWIKDVRILPSESIIHNLSPAFVEHILKIFNERGKVFAKIGITSKPFFPAFMLEQLKEKLPNTIFQYSDALIQKVRSIKSQNEIEVCKMAAKIADIGMEAALAAIKLGVTELEVAAKGISAIIENGGQNIWNSSPITCVSGPYSGFREVYPTARKLESGDMISIGLSCNYNGYQTRIHRSTTVGTPTDEQKKFLETALNVQEAITGTVQFGVKISDLIEIQKTLLNNSGYEKQAGSFLGCGIGTDMFNEPVLVDGFSNPDDEIMEGMLLMIGPAISKEGLGTACFQDAVLIDDKTHQILNKCKKRLW